MDNNENKINKGEFLAKLIEFFKDNFNNIKDEKLKSILHKVLITEFFLCMTDESNNGLIEYKGKEVRPMVCVPLNLYISFHKRFNQGELFVYSGRKDGSNRKIGRNNKGVLKDMQLGDPVWPFELLMLLSPNSEPLSEFGEKMEKAYNATKVSNFTFIYDKNNKLLGVKFADGSEINL